MSVVEMKKSLSELKWYSQIWTGWQMQASEDGRLAKLKQVLEKSLSKVAETARFNNTPSSIDWCLHYYYYYYDDDDNVIFIGFEEIIDNILLN